MFRSECLYLNCDTYPTEEMQFEAYCKVLSDMGDKEVVIRTLGIGADKQIGYFNLPQEETPASVLMSDRLAKEVNFFSIGTNDLTQYALACDRQNNDLGRFYAPHHPAILRAIKMVVDNARKNNTWVGICGELGADLELTETFLAIGVDELSVTPSTVLHLCNRVREIDTTESAARILFHLEDDCCAE